VIVFSAASIISFFISAAVLISLDDRDDILFFPTSALLYLTFALTIVTTIKIFSHEHYPKTRFDNVPAKWTGRFDSNYDKVNTIQSLGPYDKSRHTKRFLTRFVPASSIGTFLLLFTISIIPTDGPVSREFIEQTFLQFPFGGWLWGPVYGSIQVVIRLANTLSHLRAKEKPSHK
jgi:hypothetical protein